MFFVTDKGCLTLLRNDEVVGNVFTSSICTPAIKVDVHGLGFTSNIISSFWDRFLKHHFKFNKPGSFPSLASTKSGVEAKIQ